MRVHREKLYEEVWAEPMTTVAKRYTVSANCLARVCERLHVPRPGREYWAQQAAGQRIRRDPLPEAQPGDELECERRPRALLFVPGVLLIASSLAGCSKDVPPTSRWTSDASAGARLSAPEFVPPTQRDRTK